MNILAKLSFRNIKLNKKRNAVSTIGIILSVALITCVATMFTSIQESARLAIIYNGGDYHFSTNKVSIFNEITSNPNIEKPFKIHKIYQSSDPKANQINPNPYSKNTPRQTIVYSISEDVFPFSSTRILQGGFPKDQSEIIINQNTISNLKDANGQQYKIGDTLKLDKQYTISGIYETSNHIFGDFYYDNLFITKTNPNQLDSVENTTLYYSLKNPSSADAHFNQYYKNIKPEEFKQSGGLVSKNDSLLKISGVGIKDDSMRVLAIFAGAIIFIIIFTSVFVIKNSFTISVTEKVREFGILKSLGATSRQIHKIITAEASILGAIGISFGLALGIIANYILIWIVNYLLSDFIDQSTFLVVKISIHGIIFAIILSVLTIYLSVAAIAFRAKKISAISAIKSLEDIKISSKKLKTPKIIAKIFGIGGIIAYKNLKRSRKKYRTTVFSLVISVIAFITVNFIVGSIFSTASNSLGQINFNYGLNISLNSPFNKIDKTKVIKDVDNIVKNYIKDSEYTISRNAYGSVLSSDLNPDFKDFLKKNKMPSYDSNDKYEIQVNILDDKSFQRLLNKNKIKATYPALISETIRIESRKNKIVTHVFDTNSAHLTLTKITRPEVENPNLDNYLKNFTESKHDITTPLTKIKHLPIGYNNLYNMSGPQIFVSESDPRFKPFYDSAGHINIFANLPKVKEAEKDIKLFLETSGHKKGDFNIFGDAIRAMYNMMLIIQIFGYGFIAVITLIGLTNVFNTIHTNILLRRREFSALRSIGITNKELNKIVALESLFYGLKSLIIGIILGVGITIWLHQTINMNANIPYEPPYFAVITSIIFVFLVVYIIMRYSIKTVNKQNLIETIRNENI